MSRDFRPLFFCSKDSTWAPYQFRELFSICEDIRLHAILALGNHHFHISKICLRIFEFESVDCSFIVSERPSKFSIEVRVVIVVFCVVNDYAKPFLPIQMYGAQVESLLANK